MIKDYMNKITLGNCFEHLDAIEHESIDLVVTDPPYGISYKSALRGKDHKFNNVIANDNNLDWLPGWFEQLNRVMKPNSNAYIFCSWRHMDIWQREAKKHFKLANVIIWLKNNHTCGDTKCAYANRYEPCMFLLKGRPELNGKRLNDVWQYARVSHQKALHQNQKPVGFIETAIEKSSKQGDIVLDPFAGSGTTAIAAHNTYRNFICFEQDPEYHQIAQARIEQHQLQGRLL